MSTLLQFRVEDEVKKSLEAVFGLDGLSPAQGMKVLAYQIARSGRSPLTSRFDLPNEATRRAIAEARRLEAPGSTERISRYGSAREMASAILGEGF